MPFKGHKKLMIIDFTKYIHVNWWTIPKGNSVMGTIVNMIFPKVISL